MNVLLLGAGAQGAPCAAILARRPEVQRVLLGCRTLAAAEVVRERVASPKLAVAQVDVAQPSTVVHAAFEHLDTVDVVIDLTPSFVSMEAMRAALALGAHYVNTSVHLDHAMQFIERRPLALAADFAAAGRTALMGCGVCAGVSNVIARLFTDRLDTVERIEIRCGVPAPAQKAVVKSWTPAFSPEQQYYDFVMPPCVFQGGRHEHVPPFHEPEVYDFGGRLGEIQLTHHYHEEPYSLPVTIGKGIQYCCFKYPVEPAVATLWTTGFTPDRVVEVNGVPVKALDLLMRLVPRPAEVGLLDVHRQRQFVPFLSDVRCHVLVQGSVGGQSKSYRVESPIFYDQVGKALELFGSVNVPVAYAAVAGALQVVEGRTRHGIVWPEELDAKRYVEIANALGLTLNLTVQES